MCASEFTKTITHQASQLITSSNYIHNRSSLCYLFVSLQTMSAFIYIMQDYVEENARSIARNQQLATRTVKPDAICYVTVVVIPTICIVGIVGNVLCIAVMARYEKKSSYYTYLIGKYLLTQLNQDTWYVYFRQNYGLTRQDASGAIWSFGTEKIYTRCRKITSLPDVTFQGQGY